jgi:hypothetical protein
MVELLKGLTPMTPMEPTKNEKDCFSVVLLPSALLLHYFSVCGFHLFRFFHFSLCSRIGASIGADRCYAFPFMD